MFILLNDILLALNNKASVGSIFCDLEKAFDCVNHDLFCDLEKAFDCVNHDLLMKKLKFYGIVGNAYALIQSYLSDRYRVLIDDNQTVLHFF
jgi:hypothetical protein